MGLACRRLDHPLACHLVEMRADHVGVEQVVLPQVEPVGDMIQVGQDLGLCREPFRPRPVALQFVVERV